MDMGEGFDMGESMNGNMGGFSGFSQGMPRGSTFRMSSNMGGN